jgi:uncharacterized protein (DUF433 family)
MSQPESHFRLLMFCGYSTASHTLKCGIFKKMNERIISDPSILSGTPVFRGTRIPVEHIAELLRKGVPDTDIAQDCPALSTEDVTFARTYSARRTASASSTPPRPVQLRRKTRAA